MAVAGLHESQAGPEKTQAVHLSQKPSRNTALPDSKSISGLFLQPRPTLANISQ